MNNVLINKIKNALKSENPLENIKDVVAQYEEIQRLVNWRNKITKSDEDYNNNIIEIIDVNDKIDRSGLYQESIDDQFNKEIKEFFKNL